MDGVGAVTSLHAALATAPALNCKLADAFIIFYSLLLPVSSIALHVRRLHRYAQQNVHDVQHMLLRSVAFTFATQTSYNNGRRFRIVCGVVKSFTAQPQ